MVSAATALLVHAKSRRKAWGGGGFDDGATCFPGFFWRHLVASEVGLIPSCTLVEKNLTLFNKVKFVIFVLEISRNPRNPGM